MNDWQSQPIISCRQPQLQRTHDNTGTAMTTIIYTVCMGLRDSDQAMARRLRSRATSC